MTSKGNKRVSEVRIRRGKVKSFDLYEVTGDELKQLCKPPSSAYLNFAILFSTVATSFLIALLTVPIGSNRVFTVFVVIVVVGYVASSILLVLWLLNRRSVSGTADKIKKRIPAKC